MSYKRILLKKAVSQNRKYSGSGCFSDLSVLSKTLFFLPSVLIMLFILFSCSSLQNVSNTSNASDKDTGSKESGSPSLAVKPGEAQEAPEASGTLPEGQREKGVSGNSSSGPAAASGAGECSPREIEKLYHAAAANRITKEGRIYLPVSEGNKLTFISGDFTGDGCPEFYVLYSEGSAEDDVLKLSITDIKNIYQEDVGLRQYLLASYIFSDNAFVYKGYVNIESRGAFSYLEKKEINRNTKTYALSAGFLTSEGSSEDLVIFSRDGKYSTITIRNTLSDSMRKDDIDNDGVLDLLRYEQIFVDGSGAETFITWFKFNGKEYLPVKTVNTVKDLRSFLEKSEQLLEGKELEKFIEDSISAPVLRKIKSAGISSSGILQRVFIPARRDTGSFADIGTLLSSEAGIDFTFPVILENPFRMERDNLYSFTTYVKASLKGAENTEDNEAIYLVRIYMAANPFAARKYFYFVN